MSVWLWILIGLVAVVVLFFLVTTFTQSNRWPDDDAVLDYARGQAFGSALLGENPVCRNCGTVYNRQEVIRQLKTQSPQMFDFGAWTTRFRCKTCRAEVGISGSGGE